MQQQAEIVSSCSFSFPTYESMDHRPVGGLVVSCYAPNGVGGGSDSFIS